MKTCPQCSASFQARRSDAVYCDQKCRYRHGQGTPAVRACAGCGSDISHRVVNARYCAPCYKQQEIQHSLRDLTCHGCGAHFRGPARQKHCSRRCGMKASRAAQLAIEHTVACRACGQEFTTRDVRPVACSTACKQWARKYPGVPRLLYRECRGCAEPFAGRTAAQRYCTDQCVARSGQLLRRARERGAWVEPVSRLLVAERDAWTCQLCSEQVTPQLAYPDPMCASLDHIVPLARGGEHSTANTQLAHLICNVRKGSKTVA